jgi:putative transposase
VRRAVVAILVEEHEQSVRQACVIAGLSRTAYSRPARASVDADAPVIAALTTVIAAECRWGFWKCFDRLRALGHAWNHKRVYRVYCALKLNQVRRTKKRVPTRTVVPLHALPQLNDTWAMDFMRDTLYDGRAFRILNVLDEGNREALAIEVDVSLPCTRVVAVLDQLVAMHGVPRRIRVDNGPEFIALELQQWCARHHVQLAFIQPGKPNQNAYIERFNRSYRFELLDAWVFQTVAEVQELSEAWRVRYNTERAHDALGRVPPSTFLPRAPNPVPVSDFKRCA